MAQPNQKQSTQSYLSYNASQSSKKRLPRKVVIPVLCVLAVALTVLWANYRLEPLILFRLKKQVNAYDFLITQDGLLHEQRTQSSCRESGDWNFLGDKFCNVEKIYTVSDLSIVNASDLSDKLQSRLKGAGWTTKNYMTDPNYQKIYLIYFSANSSDQICRMLATYSAPSSTEVSPESRVSLACYKDLRFKRLFL